MLFWRFSHCCSRLCVDRLDDNSSASVSNSDVLPEDADSETGCSIRAATVPALIRTLVQIFKEENGSSGATLPRLVFRMHRWWNISSAQLGRHLVNVNVPDSNSDLLKSICLAFRYWFSAYPDHVHSDSELSDVVNEFASTLPTQMKSLLTLPKETKYSSRKISVSTPLSNKCVRVSLVFDQLNPKQLAEHITYLEFETLQVIPWQEFREYVHAGGGGAVLERTPRLGQAISQFNGLTQWVLCMILSKTTPQQRASLMTKFILLAKELLSLHNFNSLMAVVGALAHSALARLSRTHGCLSSEARVRLAEYVELLSASGNFAAYRRALQAARSAPFRLPILGIHLKDLISLHVALPDWLDDDKLNVRKLAQISVILDELESTQDCGQYLPVDPDLADTLRLSLDLAYTDAEIFELSLAREPRNNSSPQTAPQPSTTEAFTWQPPPAPNPLLIERHVDAMVAAVFRAYDIDGDGFISQEEFHAVAGNFPFVDSFGALDTNQDGQISQSEMRDYFMKANCHALRHGFKHNFHETTYFRPTNCIHCTGLLWGVIRQGYKCRDCGINAHKHCKDLVVGECRFTNYPPMQPDTPTTPSPTKNRFLRKKKSSLSESESSTPPSPKYSTTSCPTSGELEQLCAAAAAVNSSRLLSRGKTADMLLVPTSEPVLPRRKISDSLLYRYTCLEKTKSDVKILPENNCTCPASQELKACAQELEQAQQDKYCSTDREMKQAKLTLDDGEGSEAEEI